MRGEFVLLVEGHAANANNSEVDAARILSILLAEFPLSRAASLTSRITGIRKNRL
jgi:16S rRNA (cytidine1402-2'-O)-methyltransferase